eukprot:6193718-Pleurochrysis_carterae.AAC.1
MPFVTREGDLAGATSVLRIFAQNMLYAYSSGLYYIFPPSPTEIYDLIAWQHWHRSVAAVNVLKATENAPLLHDLLKALNPTYTTHEAASGHDPIGATQSSGSKNVSMSGNFSTFYIGHDGNLDGLAALLDLEWDAPPYKGGRLLPTPPGSGLRF